MINGAVIRDFYIDAWRSIPELVAAMNGNEGLIRSSSGVARIQTSLERAVLDMGFPGILVAYQGFTKGHVRNNEITLHQIAAFVRAATADDDAHIAFGLLMTDGIPDGQEQKVRYLSPDPDADPMDMPRFERVGASHLPEDIWKLSFAVPERAG